ncbi:hypothetical protein H0H87_002919 [Tephrocybe sp. NHM501043]|nr:hypothetical protein H0H87_002919 [Tephrocybe sp. NHM501043]
MLGVFSRQSSHAPRIGDDILPTPAEEWAEVTVTSIKDSADRTALVPLVPSESSTPGPHIPGEFPNESVVDYSRGIAFNSGYIHTQQNFRKAVVDASVTAKQYLPDSLAAYFPDTRGTTANPNATPRECIRNESPLHQDIQELETVHSGTSEAAPSSSAASSSVNVQEQETEEGPPFTARAYTDTSYLTPHTNPDKEDDSFVRSNVSTKTLHGSPVTSPSQYSSQPSLTPPGIPNGAMHSDSETADMTHYSSDTRYRGLENGTAYLSVGNGEKVSEPASKHEDNLDTPYSNGSPREEHGSGTGSQISQPGEAEGPYPPFLGPIDAGDDGLPPRKASGDEPELGSSVVSPKTGNFDETLDPEASEGFQGVQQPRVNTQARTHPLAGQGAKWKGVPLEESYQRAMDDSSDRQLNIGNVKDNTISATKPAYEERKTQETRRGFEGVENRRSGSGDKKYDGPRQRTASVGINKSSEDHGQGHRRSASESTPGAARERMNKAPPETSKISKPSRASWINKLKGEMKVVSDFVSPSMPFGAQSDVELGSTISLMTKAWSRAGQRGYRDSCTRRWGGGLELGVRDLDGSGDVSSTLVDTGDDVAAMFGVGNPEDDDGSQANCQP